MAQHCEQSCFIECEWEKSFDLNTAKPFFFFGERAEPKKPSKHYKIELEPNRNYRVIGAETEIKVELKEENRITFKFPTFQTTFISPDGKISAKGNLKSIDINNTGNLMVLAEDTGKLKILNTNTGAELRVLEGHIMDVYQCCFFPSGLVVLSGGMDFTVRVWSVELETNVRTFKGHTRAITGLAIIGLGAEVLSCSDDGTVRKWSCPEDKEVKKWDFNSGPCKAICIGSDHISSWFAVACENGQVFIEDVNESEICNFSIDGCPSALSFDTYGIDQFIYVGDEAGTIAAYNVEQKKVVYTLKTFRRDVTKIISHMKGIIVSYRDGSIALYSRDGLSTGVKNADFEFSGSDCAIIDMAVVDRHLYAMSKESCIRKYTLP